MGTEDLLLLSLGGAAATVARRVAERATAPLRALILDTDDAVLQTLTPAVGVATSVFGVKRLSGRGTGGDHNLGAGAFRDDAAQILAQIGTPRLVVALACCGGGTSGALPLLLEQLRAQGIATVVFATEPFAFEGEDRRKCARVLLPTLGTRADALARIPLDTLLGADLDCPAAEAFDRAADRLAAGLGVLWALLAHPGFLAFDAERFRRLVDQDRPTALPFFLADATAEGEDRAERVLEALLASPCLRPDGVDRLANASWLLVGVLAGPDLRLRELGVLMGGLRGACKALREDFLGTTEEPTRQGLSAVALAFGDATAEGAPPDATRPIGGRRGKHAHAAARGTGLGAAQNRFSDVEHTLHEGQDLDIPTYQRRGIRLTR